MWLRQSSACRQGKLEVTSGGAAEEDVADGMGLGLLALFPLGALPAGDLCIQEGGFRHWVSCADGI